MDTYSAAGLAARTGTSGRWNESAEQFERGAPVPMTVDRDARSHLHQLGPLQVARLIDGATLDRLIQPAGGVVPRSYIFIVQVSGSSVLHQYGQQARLQPGDLALSHNAAPLSHWVAERAEMVALRVPAHVLREHLPSPEHFCGRLLASTTGMTAVIGLLLANLPGQVESGLPVQARERLAHQILEMIATSYAIAFDQLIAPSSVVGGRHAKAKLFIEQNLRDPDLGPRSIAQSLKVSSRYLRMIFAGANESVSSYILRRRLEESARQLTDPRWRGRSICEIAFGWGFNSAPHFSRSFRDRYGVSPRQYRARDAAAHEQLRSDHLAAAR